MLKQFLLSTALISSVVVPAFAVPQVSLRDGDLMSPEVAKYHSDVGDIAAIALGTLISAIEADRRHDDRESRVDNADRRDRERDSRDARRDRFGRGGPGRGHGGWGRGREPDYVCFAENRRGETFKFIDRDPRYAQDEAVRECYRYSMRCRPMGCREIR